jgi:hypothetical protein
LLVLGTLGAMLLSVAAPQSEEPPQAKSRVADASKNESAQVHHGLLAQEIVRQAFLAAAPDGMGLVTPEITRLQVGDGKSPPLTFNIETLFMPRKLTRVTVRRGADEQGPILGTLELAMPASLVAAAEGWSRTSFCELLKKAGLTGKARPVKPDVAVPAKTEELLAQMTFTAQFSALRMLHQALATAGESPHLVGALARGYANLGILTECHWCIAHKGFKARSLLYAEKLVAANPKAAEPLWHRAYASALVGLHQVALEDLEMAANLAATAGKPVTPPPWVKVIDAYCRYDTARLDEAAKDRALTQLAELLAFLTVEDPSAESL